MLPGSLFAQEMAKEAGDPAEVATEQYAVEFENDAVRVLRVSYAPGAKSAMHSHPGHVAILTTDGTYRVTGSDGEVLEISGVRGDALWAPAGSHTIENPGDAAMEAFLVEIADGEADAMMREASDEDAMDGDAMADEAADPTEVAAEQYSVIFENDQVRVLRAAYEPGSEAALHGHPGMVAVLMSDGEWLTTDPAGESQTVESQAGTASWSDPYAHTMKNAGEASNEAILVELK